MKLFGAIAALAVVVTSLNAAEMNVSKDNKAKLHVQSEIGSLVFAPRILDKSYRSYRFKSDGEGGAVYADRSGKDQATVKVSFAKKENNTLQVTYTFNFTNRKNTRARYVGLRFPVNKWMGSELKLDRTVIPFGEETLKEKYGYARNITLYNSAKKKILNITSVNGINYTVSDLRRWKDPKIEVRIRLRKGQNVLKFSVNIPSEEPAAKE